MKRFVSAILVAVSVVSCNPDATDVDEDTGQPRNRNLDDPDRRDSAGNIDRGDLDTSTFQMDTSVTVVDSTGEVKLAPRITYIQRGSGEKIEEGDVVLINYTGRVKGGKIFDSSERIGQPLGLKVGMNMVVPGWEMALLELKEGDQVKVEIPSELAYKDKAYGRLIPANSDLIVNMEVVEIVEPIEVEYGVKVYPLNKGGGQTPVEGDIVEIQYTGYLSNGRVFDTSNKNEGLFSFELGKLNVMPGIQYGVLTMEVGQRAILDIPSEVGYAEKGLVDRVPPNEDLTFLIYVNNVK